MKDYKRSNRVLSIIVVLLFLLALFVSWNYFGFTAKVIDIEGLSCFDLGDSAQVKINSACFDSNAQETKVIVERSLESLDFNSLEFNTVINNYGCGLSCGEGCTILDKGETKKYVFSANENEKEIEVSIKDIDTLNKEVDFEVDDKFLKEIIKLKKFKENENGEKIVSLKFAVPNDFDEGFYSGNIEVYGKTVPVNLEVVDEEDSILDEIRKSPPFVKGVGVIILFTLLWLLFLVYLILRRYLKIRNKMNRIKSREEKIGYINHLKREVKGEGFSQRIAGKIAMSIAKGFSKKKKKK